MFKKKQAKVSETVPNGMAPLQSKDDALFETLNRNKKAKKKNFANITLWAMSGSGHWIMPPCTSIPMSLSAS